jgi:hypothetical protein
MDLPAIRPASSFSGVTSSVLYVTAIGFERRGEEWLRRQSDNALKGCRAVLFNYRPQQGRPREKEMAAELERVGLRPFKPLIASIEDPLRLEDSISKSFALGLDTTDEVVIDISTMSKLLILLSVCKLRPYKKRVRFVYTELADYAPSREAFAAILKGLTRDAPLPSRGSESIVRSPAISSIRMQGQPIAVIAFTSFNEQLVRHVLASVSPHQLILLGGVPPHEGLAWRELATQQIHQRVIEEYRSSNPIDSTTGLLINRVSTFHYAETYRMLEKLHQQFGGYVRIMAAATGSKMQTLGLALAKQVLSDIHIEYPTPKSYYVKEDNPYLVAGVHEVVFEDFKAAIDDLRASALDYEPEMCFEQP